MSGIFAHFCVVSPSLTQVAQHDGAKHLTLVTIPPWFSDRPEPYSLLNLSALIGAHSKDILKQQPKDFELLSLDGPP